MKICTRTGILSLISTSFCLLISIGVYAQVTHSANTKFSSSFISANFIENKGQFNSMSGNNESVQFAAFTGGANILISNKAVQYVQVVAKKETEEDERGRRAEKHEREFETRRLTMEWVGANPNALFATEQPCPDYFSSPDPANKNVAIFSSCFNRIIAKDLYPGIDVIYTFRQDNSLEYSLVVHPGADISKVKIHWDGAENVSLNANGEIEIQHGEMGTTTDHAPISFYEGSKEEISSSFVYDGKKFIGFRVGDYDHTKTLIIDPWTFNPGFTGFNSAYDIMQDFGGDIYLYGGSNPYVVKKFTSTGTPIWTFSTMANGYYGDFCLEPATGNIFCVYGPWGDYVMKLTPTATIIWSVNSGNTYSREIYRVYMNPASNQLSIMGMNMPSSQLPMVLSVDPATGTYGAPVVHPTCTSGEIRGMCVDVNGDVYGEVFNAAGSSNPANDNLIWHVNSAFTTINSVVDGYLLDEVDPSQTDSWFSGYNGMAVGCDLYSFNGITLKKWDKTTLAFIGSVTIPGGIEYNTSGICLDACGNVYVGSPAGVREYDAALNLVTTIATSGPVYDVCLGQGAGEILACGSGFFASLSFPPGSCSSTTTTASIPSSGCTCTGQASIAVQAMCSAGSFTYQWFPSGGTNDTAFNLCPGTYTVVYTNTATGSIDSTTVTVTGNSNAMTVTSTSTNPTCFGSSNGSITANPSGGTGPYTYLWHPGNQTTQTISGVIAGTYTVDVTDASGCTVSQTITLTQPPGMTFTTANTATACTACNGTATVNASGGTGPYTYSWNSTPVQTTSTATSLCQGTYTCTITDANGCAQDTSVIVPLIGGLSSTLSVASPILCFGQCTGSLTATATSGTGPYTYSWNTTPVQTTATATGLCTGTYSVDITDANGCTTSNTFTLIQPTLLTANTISPVNICAGICTTLSSGANGGTPTYTYSWNPGSLSGNNLSVCPPSSTNYTVTVADANGCTATDSIQVNVLALPVVAFAADTQQGCAPLCVTFTNNTANTQTLLWEYGNQNQDANGFQCYSPGVYDVTLVITGTNGCVDSLTNVAYINSWSSPTAGFVPTVSQTTLLEANFCFNETATNETAYLWDFNDPNDLTTSTTASPCHSYSDTGYYCVQQIVYSANGCTDTTISCVEVLPDPGAIYVPNTFTPNGDGKNNIFIPLGYNIDGNHYHFMVFDRWGMLIYETNTWGEGWDGTYKGNKCQIDTYVWKVDAMDISGINHRLIGHVNLIR